MIVVDTSALLEITLDKPLALPCMEALDRASSVLISAGTLTEALIVAGRRKVETELQELITGLDIEIIPVTAESAYRAGLAYEKWGKGVHPAKLNFGDCFAYELAMNFQCPLLYVGNDFAQTDVRAAA